MASISDRQRSIASEIEFSGRALQTGAEASVRLKPLPPSSGIIFTRVDKPGNKTMRLSGEVLTGSGKRQSTISAGAVEIQTVEHFLAALWALGIDNLLVEVNGPEIPAMDGSAKAFLSVVRGAGTVEYPQPKELIKVTEPVIIKDRGRSLAIYPGDAFSVSYLIDYPVASIGRELFSLELDGDTFEREIAPARTFCLKKEAEMLLRMGFGRGATLDNTLVMDERGPVGTTLRFPNEPVRHKILDLVGDLYMLGMPVIGRVVAEKSGHSLNARLVKELYRRYVKKDEERRRKDEIKEGPLSGKRSIKDYLYFLLPPFSFLLNKRKD